MTLTRFQKHLNGNFNVSDEQIYNLINKND